MSAAEQEKKHIDDIITQFTKTAGSDHAYHQFQMKQQIYLYNMIMVKINQLDRSLERNAPLSNYNITAPNAHDRDEFVKLQEKHRFERDARVSQLMDKEQMLPERSNTKARYENVKILFSDAIKNSRNYTLDEFKTIHAELSEAQYEHLNERLDQLETEMFYLKEGETRTQKMNLYSELKQLAESKIFNNIRDNDSSISSTKSVSSSRGSSSLSTSSGTVTLVDHNDEKLMLLFKNHHIEHLSTFSNQVQTIQSNVSVVGSAPPETLAKLGGAMSNAIVQVGGSIAGAALGMITYPFDAYCAWRDRTLTSKSVTNSKYAAAAINIVANAGTIVFGALTVAAATAATAVSVVVAPILLPALGLVGAVSTIMKDYQGAKWEKAQIALHDSAKEQLTTKLEQEKDTISPLQRAFLENKIKYHEQESSKHQNARTEYLKEGALYTGYAAGAGLCMGAVFFPPLLLPGLVTLAVTAGVRAIDTLVIPAFKSIYQWCKDKLSSNSSTNDTAKVTNEPTKKMDNTQQQTNEINEKSSLDANIKKEAHSSAIQEAPIIPTKTASILLKEAPSTQQARSSDHPTTRDFRTQIHQLHEQQHFSVVSVEHTAATSRATIATHASEHQSTYSDSHQKTAWQQVKKETEPAMSQLPDSPKEPEELDSCTQLKF